MKNKKKYPWDKDQVTTFELNEEFIFPEDDDSAESTAPVEEEPVGSITSLEFEIAKEDEVLEESQTSVRVDTDITPRITDVTVEVDVTEEVDSEDDSNEEFQIPNSFEVDEKYNTQSFMETPSSIRPTYLPRFTEISDTYRMQDDPRPRPVDTGKSSPKIVEKTEDSDNNSSHLDPTSEKVEEKKVKKVIVSSGIVKNDSETDESITILKFSTPVENEPVAPVVKKIERVEVDEEEEEIAEEITETIAEADVSEEVELEQAFETEEKTEAVDDTSEETDSEVVEEKGDSFVFQKTKLPDPDSTYKVVDFARENENHKIEEPLGASETLEKVTAKTQEFNSPIQRDSIKDKFLDLLMSIKVRLVGSLLLLAAMIFVDVLGMFGVNAYEYFGLGHIVSTKAFVDMQFCICLFLFALPEVVNAIKRLINGKFTPELFIVAGLPVVIANDLVLALNGAVNYATFGVIYGLQCVSVIVASYFKAETDFENFKVISKNVAKNVLDKRFTRELPRENQALDGAIDEYDSHTVRMFRTVFVSGFFKRSSESCENSSNVSLMLAVSAGISLVAGLVSLFINNFSAVYAMQAFTMVFMVSLPVFAVLSHKLPYKHVCIEAKGEEGTFIGESALYEGSEVDVVTYEDTEIFGTEDVSIRKVHLYGKVYNTPKAMKQMYSLFSVVGGPLDYVFSSALDRKCPGATDIVIEADGISGLMEDHRVYAGTEEYMLRHGIEIPADDYRSNPSAADSTKVMYGAEDGEVYVKFFIRYSFSEEFTMLLPDLKSKNIVPLVYTRDPNINGDLLKVLTLGEDSIRVMKKYVPRTTEEKTYRHIDSGIVTYGDKDNAINMVLSARKYSTLLAGVSVTELVCMMISAVISVFCAIGGKYTLPVTLFALWHIIWCAVLFIRSKLTFTGRAVSPAEDVEYEQN